jgi:serine/threonine protein kinase/tetratricopeptide (TPR) repeat protein
VTPERFARVEHLFDAACRLPQGERAEFVARQAQDDDGEVIAVVRALLAEDVGGSAAADALSEQLAAARGDADLRQRLLSRLAAGGNAGAVLAPAGRELAGAPGSAEGPGTRIGPYRLLQQIGEGGFGAVFLAEQDKPVARRVALKIIKLGMDTRQVVARFEQERQALALMDHPNIARVLDAGATDAGRPYFVMDLVKGAPIVEYCDKNNLTIGERLELCAQVCHAVQHAHSKGIIHRDLKPSNILVGSQDGKPQAKVIDFGIAKATSSKLTDKTLFTEHQQIIGTLVYMSPEQAAGSLDIDTRTDVYSLGVLLYELLTGSTPFDSKTLDHAMYGELQRMIRETEPQKPSTRLSRSQDALADIAARRRVAPSRLGTILRGELDWIVMKALEKDRTRRYETANGLATDVRRYLAGDTVAAAPPSASYRLRKFVKRHRGRVIAGGIVAASLVLGVIGTTVGLLRALGEKERADAQAVKAMLAAAAEAQAKVAAQENERKARDEAQRAQAAKAAETKARARAETISAFVTTALRASDAENAGGRPDTTILAAMDSAIADLESGRFRDDPETEAVLKNTIATILRNNGRVAKAHALAVQVLETYQRLHQGDHADVAASLNGVAIVTDALGRKAEAETLMVKSLEMYRRLYADENMHVAALLNNVGELRVALGRAAQAEPLLVQSLEMHQRLFGSDDEAVAKCLDNLAGARHALGRLDEAEDLYVQALDMRRRLYAGDHPDLAVGMNNLATLVTHRGRAEEAVRLFSDALAMRRRLYPGDHPAVVQGLTNLALIRGNHGQAAQAEPLIVEALEMSRRLFPGDHHVVAHCLYTLASIRLALNNPAAAEAVCVQSLEMHQRLIKDDHMGVAMSLANLARARHALHQHEQARQSFDAALAMLRRLPDGAEPLVGTLWRSAHAHLDNNEGPAALAELEETVALAEKVLPVASPKLATYRAALAQCKAAVEAGKNTSPGSSKH